MKQKPFIATVIALFIALIGIAPLATYAEECEPDDTPPTIHFPEPNHFGVISADAHCEVELKDYRLLITDPSQWPEGLDAWATDNCTATEALTITQIPAPGMLDFDDFPEWPREPIEVMIYVSDASDNVASIQIATIEDTTPPTIAPIQLFERIVVDTDEHGAGTFAIPDFRWQVRRVADDNCSLRNTLIVTQEPAPGTYVTLNSFPAGRTVVVTVTNQADLSSVIIGRVEVVDRNSETPVIELVGFSVTERRYEGGSPDPDWDSGPVSYWYKAWQCGVPFERPGAWAYNPVTGEDLTLQLNMRILDQSGAPITGRPDTNQVGARFTVEYWLEDGDGNRLSTVELRVEVADMSPPVIELEAFQGNAGMHVVYRDWVASAASDWEEPDWVQLLRKQSHDPEATQLYEVPWIDALPSPFNIEPIPWADGEAMYYACSAEYPYEERLLVHDDCAGVWSAAQADEEVLVIITKVHMSGEDYDDGDESFHMGGWLGDVNRSKPFLPGCRPENNCHSANPWWGYRIYYFAEDDYGNLGFITRHVRPAAVPWMEIVEPHVLHVGCDGSGLEELYFLERLDRAYSHCLGDVTHLLTRSGDLSLTPDGYYVPGTYLREYYYEGGTGFPVRWHRQVVVEDVPPEIVFYNESGDAVSDTGSAVVVSWCDFLDYPGATPEEQAAAWGARFWGAQPGYDLTEETPFGYHVDHPCDDNVTLTARLRVEGLGVIEAAMVAYAANPNPWLLGEYLLSHNLHDDRYNVVWAHRPIVLIEKAALDIDYEPGMLVLDEAEGYSLVSVECGTRFGVPEITRLYDACSGSDLDYELSAIAYDADGAFKHGYNSAGQLIYIEYADSVLYFFYHASGALYDVRNAAGTSVGLLDADGQAVALEQIFEEKVVYDPAEHLVKLDLFYEEDTVFIEYQALVNLGHTLIPAHLLEVRIVDTEAPTIVLLDADGAPADMQAGPGDIPEAETVLTWCILSERDMDWWEDWFVVFPASGWRIEDACDDDAALTAAVSVTDEDGLYAALEALAQTAEPAPWLGSYRLRHEVSDAGGNLAVAYRVVQIVHRPPRIEHDLPDTLVFECGDEIAPAYTGWDDCDNDLTDEVVIEIIGDGASFDSFADIARLPGDYTVTLRLTDAEGQDATPASFVIIINEDTQPPVIALVEPDEALVDEDGYYLLDCGVVWDEDLDPGYAAYDQCGEIDATGREIWALSMDGEVATDASGGPIDHAPEDMMTLPGDYVFIYWARDDSGNETPGVADHDEEGNLLFLDEEGQPKPFARLVRVSRANAVIDVVLTPGENVQGGVTLVECGSGAWTEPGVTAVDSCEGALPADQITMRLWPCNLDTGQLVLDDGVPVEASPELFSQDTGQYVAVYVAENSVGAFMPPLNDSGYPAVYSEAGVLENPLAPYLRRVRVVDTQKPVLSLIGAPELEIDFGASYDDDGAQAMDACEGDISERIIVTNPVNSTVAGTYTIVYTVTDTSGNAADPITRLVTVLPGPPEEGEDEEGEGESEEGEPEEGEDEEGEGEPEEGEAEEGEGEPEEGEDEEGEGEPAEGEDDGRVTTPSVVGLHKDDATQQILQSGLRVGNVDRAYSDAIPRDHVISQAPEAGVRVALNSSVSMVQSRGPVEKDDRDCGCRGEADKELSVQGLLRKLFGDYLLIGLTVLGLLKWKHVLS